MIAAAEFISTKRTLYANHYPGGGAGGISLSHSNESSFFYPPVAVK